MKQSKLFSDLGFTPKFYASDILDLSDFESSETSDKSLPKPNKIGIIITEEFGKSLRQWIQTDLSLFLQNEDLIKKKVFDLNKKIYDLDYFNMDGHFGNILYDPTSNDVRLLDVVMEEIDESNKLDPETFESLLEDMWENDRSYALKKAKNKRSLSN